MPDQKFDVFSFRPIFRIRFPSSTMLYSRRPSRRNAKAFISVLEGPELPDPVLLDTNLLDTNLLDTNLLDTNLLDNELLDHGVFDIGLFDCSFFLVRGHQFAADLFLEGIRDIRVFLQEPAYIFLALADAIAVVAVPGA